MAALSATASTATCVELKRSLVPQAWEETVRVIGMSEYKEAALAISHAFATDELAQYLLDSDDMADASPEHRWRLHVDIMTTIVAAHCINGVVTTIGPDYDAIALWMPPGCNMDDWWTMLRSGMFRLWFRLTPGGRKRYYEELLPLLHRTKAEVMGARDDDSWYLVYIGTKPSARGRGYAGKLINDMLRQTDLEKRAVYLESSAKGNLGYYKKFGFEKQKEIFLASSSPPITLSIMVREPQPPASESTYSVSPMKEVKRPKRL